MFDGADSYGERSKAASFVGCDPARTYSPQVSDGARGSMLITIRGRSSAPHSVELYDLDEKMLAMERMDIDVQLLSVPPHALFY